jgi:hypothetical protein
MIQSRILQSSANLLIYPDGVFAFPAEAEGDVDPIQVTKHFPIRLSAHLTP